MKSNLNKLITFVIIDTNIDKTMGLLKKVKKFIATNQLIANTDTLFIGVSGGMDSVVLLSILTSIGYKCIVGHCNFHLRGEESDRDALFVRNLAESYKIPFHKIDFDTIATAKSRKISIEMAARDLRYEWFKKTAQETGATLIAVAHHSDDLAETILLNLIRGTGLKGLIGIEPKNGNIIRPLLDCSRNEIHDYALWKGLNWVLDSTNNANDYTRNKIRNQITPLLSEINPSINETLNTNSKNLRGAWKIFNDKINEIKAQLVGKIADKTTIDIEGLLKQADVETVLFELLNEFNFKSDVIKNIASSLHSTPGLQFFSDSHRLIKDRTHLIIEKKTNETTLEYEIEATHTEIDEPIRLKLNRFAKTEDFEPSKSTDTIHIDAEKINYPLCIRKWRQGDSFQPFGMSKNKKVSDFFIDSKLSIIQKEETWLLTSDENIVWIIGWRLDNRFKTDSRTNEILEISLKK